MMFDMSICSPCLRSKQRDSGEVRLDPLVITPTLPVTTGRDSQGVNRRLALFLEALAEGDRPVRLLRLVPDQVVKEWEGQQRRLNRIESEHWGHAVDVILVPRRSRTETFYNHYVQGSVSAACQPSFFPFGGSAAVDAISRQLDGPAGLVFVHRLPAMCAVLQTGQRPSRMFFDLDDVEHRMRLRSVMQRPIWPGKLIYAAHIPALLSAERKGAALSRATFVCSERDRRHLLALGMRNVVTVPNAVRMPAAPSPLVPDPTMLFIGLMTYEPNIECVTRLVRRIMPLVWQTAPQARLIVAGNGSDALPRASSADARIEYLGFVPDLDELYARTRIVCCPMINGGGTRVKLIEAAAYGKPIVATGVGAEGLAFCHNEEFLLHDDDAALAEACARLLVDDALCIRLGSSARLRMQSLYDSSSISREIRQVLKRPDGEERNP